MPYKLVVRVKGRALQFPLHDGERVVGSSAESEIRIPLPTVSRRHALLTVSANGVLVTDLGSSNGTRVAGRRIDCATPLRPGDVLHIGTVEAQIEEVDAGDLEPAVTLPTRPAPHRARRNPPRPLRPPRRSALRRSRLSASHGCRISWTWLHEASL